MMAALHAEPYGKETEIHWRERGYAIHLNVLAAKVSTAMQLQPRHYNELCNCETTFGTFKNVSS
jgi:hypothetical protein